MKFRLGFVVALAALSGGCATVTRGTTNQIQIESDPPGANARTSLNHTCTTPCTITVSRKDEFTVVLSKDGYQEQSVPVKSQLAGAGVAGFAGNVIIGGVIGMGVDAATGSTLEHVPNPVRAVLQPLRRPPVSPRGRRAARPAPAPVQEDAPGS